MIFTNAPDDWNDIQAWDRFYADTRQKHPSVYLIDYRIELYDSQVDFFLQLPDKSKVTIWFPGCGVSLAPALFASMGFHVVASDYSQEAITIQQAWQNASPDDNKSLNRADFNQLADQWIQRHAPQSTPDTPTHRGQVDFLVHDFRQPIDQQFDYIINSKAFIRLSPEQMKTVARVHYEALHAGGVAFFSNVDNPPNLCHRMESALADAGFILPSLESDRWVRQALIKVGSSLTDSHIHYPRVRKLNLSAQQQDLSEVDQIIIEYQQRRQAEHTQACQLVKSNPQTKVAYVLYTAERVRLIK